MLWILLEALMRARQLTEGETDDLLPVKQQTHCSLIFLPPFFQPVYPPQRIIDAIHALKCYAVTIFSSFVSALASFFSFFSPPHNPKHSPSSEGAPLKFFFPLRLSVTDWQKEHMTRVQMADKNKIRHVMRY